MCYSAKVEQHLRSLARQYGGEVDWQGFEELFRRRAANPKIKISRALERNFSNPQNEVERLIHQHIETYRVDAAKTWEQELFAQRTRLADAQRSLKLKDTKGARKEERIATNKIQDLVGWLGNLRASEPLEDDKRIWPNHFAPVLVRDGEQLLIRPMRYGCRMNSKPEGYPEPFNARRDRLTEVWPGLYGRRHGVVIISSFFENVPRHLYERRELAHGEQEQNVILHFNPQPPIQMAVACLWDHWTRKDVPDLYSFAAITDDPPPEVAATGHTRCIIALKDKNLREWLSPEGVVVGRLEEILRDRASLYYEHRMAA
jgi:putative SOS response-associated peptidase YedK